MKIFNFGIAVFIFILASSCNGSKLAQDTSDSLKSFDKQAHRGGRGLMPENTIPAMLKAVDLGVTTLEMDVVITSDKKVILSHETYFNAETTTLPDGKYFTKKEQPSYNIYKMTYDQTSLFDVGMKPYTVFPKQQKLKVAKPLLADVIDSVELYVKTKGQKPVFYNIETKTKPSGDNLQHPEPKEFVELIMQVIKDKKVEDRTIIQSFDFRTLQVVHALFPGIKTAALVQNKKSVEENLKDLGFVPAIYSPNYALVTPGVVAQCHQLKMKIIPWTVNEKPAIDSLKKIGVDGIISDYPDLF
jgi:glycerophosphoryl diester phosphodiesterase